MISDKQSLVPIILGKVITPFPNNVKSFALLSQVENINVVCFPRSGRRSESTPRKHKSSSLDPTGLS